VVLKLLCLFIGNVQVTQHAFKLLSELGTTTHLDMRDHNLLIVFTQTLIIKKSLCEVASVYLNEKILVNQVSEQLHYAFDVFIKLVFRYLCPAFSENSVSVGSKHLSHRDFA
jgi:hypothetical protein